MVKDTMGIILTNVGCAGMLRFALLHFVLFFYFNFTSKNILHFDHKMYILTTKCIGASLADGIPNTIPNTILQ